MKIAVLANLKSDAPKSPNDPPGRWDDLDTMETVEAIVGAIQSFGHVVRYLPADNRLPSGLDDFQPDFCFNYSVGHFGEHRLAWVPELLDSRFIPYTGSEKNSMYRAHNKHVAKNILLANGLPTAKFTVADCPEKLDVDGLHYPIFVKPANEGSSVGVNDHAVVYNLRELQRQVQWTWDFARSPVMIEEYIDGREVTVGFVGDEVLPVVEIISPLGFYSLAEKEERGSVRRECPANLPGKLTAELKRIALGVKKSLGVRDVGRVDIRLNKKGQPFVLELNPIPCLDPDVRDSSFVHAGQAAGYSYPQLINRILEAAVQRVKAEKMEFAMAAY